MEEPKQQWIEKKPVRLGISLVLIAGLIAVSYDLFLSPDAPEGVEIEAESTGKQLAEILFPKIIDETSGDDPDIEYVEKTQPQDMINNDYPTQIDEGRSGLAELDFEGHDHEHDYSKITMIPMTILDMVYFLNEHPEISDEDSGVLMSYAVAKETGMNADEEVDHLAYHIMEKIQ